MTSVLLETTRAGAGWTQHAGQVYELEDDDALALVKSGQATVVRAARIENASININPNETATHYGRRRNRNG